MKIVKTVKIGRHPNCDYQLNSSNEKTSRNHATLYIYKDGSMELEDTSTNGTFVNSTKVLGKRVWVKKDDLVKFADQERLDWDRISTPKGSRMPMVLAVVLSAILVGSGIYFVPRISKDKSISEIREQYDKSVGLVCLVYYLKTKLDDETVFVGYNDFNLLDISDRMEDLKPLVVTGSGFLVEKLNPVDNGNLVTNRHVADPAFTINRKEFDDYYTKAFFDNINKVLLDAERGKGIPENPNRVFETHPFTTKFFPAKSILPFNRDMPEFEVLAKIGDGNSQVLRWSKDENIDLAVLVTEHNPEYHYINLKEDIDDDLSKIKVGEPVTLLGYSGGIGAGYDIEKSELNYQTSSGKYSKDPSNYQIFYDIPTQGGSSGAPIFNSKGKLVAINYAKKDLNSMGIPTKHLIKVMNFENVVVKSYKGGSSFQE